MLYLYNLKIFPFKINDIMHAILFVLMRLDSSFNLVAGLRKTYLSAPLNYSPLYKLINICFVSIRFGMPAVGLKCFKVDAFHR